MKYTFITLILIITSGSLSAQSKILPVQIIGHADFLKEGDTVTLTVFKYGIINSQPSFQIALIATAHNSSFEFSFPGKSYPQTIAINFKKHYQSGLFSYFVEPGDKIHLDFANEKLAISGERSESFAIQYRLWQIKSNFNQRNRPSGFNLATLEKHFLILDSIATEQNRLLQKYQHDLSPEMFTFLQTDIFASCNGTIYGYLDTFGEQYIDSLSNPILESFRQHQLTFKERVIRKDNLNCYSNAYLAYIIEKYKVDSCLAMNRPFKIVPCLSYLIRNYDGKLREQLVVTSICNSRQFPEELRKGIDDALNFVANPAYRQVLQQIKSTRIQGAQAFNFALYDVNGKLIHLADYKNEVVVLDFWFTGCVSCRQLSPVMARIENEFKNQPVKFIGISIDKNKTQWQNSIKSGEYVSPDIINLNTNGEGAQNAVIQNFNVLSYPTLILITKTKKIVNVNADARYDQGAELRKLISNNLK